jgi:hypothetical protein
VHTATLLAVATYDDDPAVLDALADGVAARQWEPITSHRVAALRLWARGWRQSGRSVRADSPDDGTRRLPPDLPRPPVPAAGTPRRRQSAAADAPRSFARPARGVRPFPSEDMR